MNPKTKALLDSAYADFHSKHQRNADPISLVHQYSKREDQEVVAFLTALLSYGNVTTILISANKLLAALGPNPFREIKRREVWPELQGFKHRFTTGQDIQVVVSWLKTMFSTHASLEAFFNDSHCSTDAPLKDRLSDFVRRFKSQPLPSELSQTAKARERNLKYLISDPYQGSACKRLNMFLRWVVRDSDPIDLGLWKSPQKHQLMLPIDTHLLQTLHFLRWTKSKQANWRVVEQATEKLRQYAPEDPIRYDFALCHLSMSGQSLKKYLEREN